MRSYVLVILSALGLAGLFALFWTMQPAHSASTNHDESADQVMPPPLIATTQRYSGIGPGARAWMKEYDAKGQLTSELSGTKYEPQADGTINVTAPIARFYLANRQHLEVHGTTGNLVLRDVPDLSRLNAPAAGPTAPPSRGRLDDVVVYLIDEKAPPDQQRVLTMRTNNVVFDNETYRIATEGYRDASGRVVADDQVPVHMTGQYEMEGRGLTVRWNDKDGRLELLEIAHGEYLKIEHPGKYSPASGGRPPRSALPLTAQAPWGLPLPGMLADATKSGERDLITAHREPPPKPRRNGNGGAGRTGPAGPVIYLATFYENVHVTQADPTGHFDQLAIAGDRMDVNFLMKQSSSAASSTAATRPTTAEGGRTPAAHADTRPPAPPATTQPAVAAAQPSEPAEQPIYVRWTGLLRIVPAPADPPAPVPSGEAVVQVIGRPVALDRVELKQQGVEHVRCASVLFETAGQRVRFDHSESFPHILIDKLAGLASPDQRPAHVDSSGVVRYSRADNQVVLSGPGEAEVPLLEPRGDTYSMLFSAWTRQAQFDFAESPDDRQASIRHALLEGNVDVRHPKMSLRGQSLNLQFDPPPPPAPRDAEPGPALKRSGQPNLRQAIATTGVWCQMLDAQARPQTIECARLVLDTDVADGKVYPRHVNASGGAHVYAQDDLRARTIDVLLQPADPKPAAAAPAGNEADQQSASQVKLERMHAAEDVVVRSKEGSVATGDALDVTLVNGRQHAVLMAADGAPRDARVADAKHNVVTGRHVEFDPDDGRARVIGAGNLHATQQGGSTTQPGQPTDVSWTDHADLNAPANRVDVFGHVVALQVDRKGFQDIATGPHMGIDLRTKPPAPATRPAIVAAAATRPAHARKVEGGDAAAPRGDLFKDKEVVALTLDGGDARLRSTLQDAAGNVLQQFELAGPTIVVREIAPDGTPGRSVAVPRPGTLLVRDHRPPSKPAAGAKDQGDGAGGGSRGANLIQWADRLLYNEAARRADIYGQVLVVHQDEDAKSPPARIRSDHVTAWFEPEARSARTARGAAAPPSDANAPQQLKYLRADGKSVVVTRDAATLTARQLDYDPHRHLLIATGTPQNPVVFDDATPRQVVADRCEWDTITWTTRFTNATIEVRPATPPDPHAAKPRQLIPDRKLDRN